jgi:hypothetical protein
MIRRTNQCRSVALAKEACANDRARWFNTLNGTGNTSRRYLKAHADSKAGTGEIYRMRGDLTKSIGARSPGVTGCGARPPGRPGRTSNEQYSAPSIG